MTTDDPSMPESTFGVAWSDAMQTHERLMLARQRAGFKTAAEAAKAMGVKYPTYAAHENGSRGMQREAAIYARFFGVPLEWLVRGKGPAPDGFQQSTNAKQTPVPRVQTNKTIAGNSAKVQIKIVGRVAAGVFREIEQVSLEQCPVSPFPPDPSYPLEAQFDLVVEGNSINKFARDGEIVRCVDIASTGVELVDGDLVIVRRQNGALVETTAKRARRKGSAWELRFDSDDPRYQGSLVLDPVDGDQIEITAIVLYAYRPARPLAALP